MMSGSSVQAIVSNRRAESFRAISRVALVVLAAFAYTATVFAQSEASSLAPTVLVRKSDGNGISLSIASPEKASLASIVQTEPTDWDASGYATLTALPGFPQLPMVVRTVLLPPASGVQLVVHKLESRVETDYSPIITTTEEATAISAEGGAPTSDYLSTSGFWPPEPIIIGKPAILRGRRLVQVTFFPMQVNPTTGEVRYNECADFEMSFTGEVVNPVLDPSRPRPSQTLDAIIESLVVNPPFAAPRRDDIPGRGCYMLVYYDVQDIANTLAPLVEWRKRQGWNIVTAGFQQNTSANEIKSQIQEQYNSANPPEMITFVGDPDWGGHGIPAWDQSTDQGYALLEGNDVLADADYGRISAGSLEELDRVVAKIVNYESDPFMDNVEWYHRGAVCAGEAVSGISTIFINKWIRREALGRTWTDIAGWFFNNGEGSVPQFFRNQFSRGINFITYRGYVGMSGVTANDIMGYQATRRNPFATIITCATGSYVGTFGNSEAMFRSPGGAIGAVGLYGPGTHTPYNNMVLAGIWAGIFKKGLYNFGTACNYSRFDLWRQYDGFNDEVVARFSSWLNLMGDPATELWTDVPLLIDARYDAESAASANRVTVAVTDHAAGTPIRGANVCLYHANSDFQTVVVSNEHGVAEFSIPSGTLVEGDTLLVTVTKHNVKPHLGAMVITQAEHYLGVDTWEISDDTDNDGVANPGESLRLNLQIKNSGNAVPEGELTVSGESLSRWGTVTGEFSRLDQAPAVGESATVTLTVEVDPSAPDGDIIPIAVTVQSGDAVWNSMASIEIVSPKVVIVELQPDHFNTGEAIELDVSISNVGHKRIARTTARLWSATNSVVVTDSVATFSAMEPDASARIDGSPFRFRSRSLTVPGSTATLMMALESEDGFRDTVSTVITLGETAETNPFGPDDYGYVCFDSGDTSWTMRPVYDWIEIDPNVQGADFQGTLLDLQDEAEDDDHSLAIDLPFAFRYYGREFNRLTVNTNGWAAFGDWSELADFRNRRIGSAEGPDAQLCVLWDDLTTGRILTFHDEESGRFIVEWNGMLTLANRARQTFELILYDVRRYPTYSADGIIAYQYKEVSNMGSEGPSYDTPFVTVGIGNLDDTGGLEYTYFHTYAAGAKPLADSLAILFITAVEYITGVVNGRVTDLESNQPIPRAEISNSKGFWTESDSAGWFSLDDILIGDYRSLTVVKQGYNDLTWEGENGEGFSIAEDETLTVNFALSHPEFTIDVERLRFWMMEDSTTTFSANLSNDGNGPLWFNSRYVYVPGRARDDYWPKEVGPIRTNSRDEPDEQWNLLLDFSVYQQVQNLRIQSVVFVGDHWLVAGGHTAPEENNYFYEFSRDGHYTGVRHVQPVVGLYGIRNMEYYDGYVYGAYSDSSWIVKIDPADGHEIRHWLTPNGLRNARNVTIDPATSHFWMSGVTSRMFECELVGDSVFIELNRFPTTDPRTSSEMHEYGISWFADDPDGFNLYLATNDEAENDPSHPNIALFKMHPRTGETRYLTDFSFMDSLASARGGIDITPEWDNDVYALAMVLDQNEPVGDHIGVFELAPNSSWLEYTPHTDTLNAGERIPVDFTISTTDLDTGRYDLVIEFRHNAALGRSYLPINLNVVTSLDAPIPDDNDARPDAFAMRQNFPNPFNPSTTIEFSLPMDSDIRLTVYDLTGREVAILVNGKLKAGTYSANWNAESFTSGVYLVKMETPTFSASKKIALIK